MLLGGRRTASSGTCSTVYSINALGLCGLASRVCLQCRERIYYWTEIEARRQSPPPPSVFLFTKYLHTVMRWRKYFHTICNGYGNPQCIKTTWCRYRACMAQNNSASPRQSTFLMCWASYKGWTHNSPFRNQQSGRPKHDSSMQLKRSECATTKIRWYSGPNCLQ